MNELLHLYINNGISLFSKGENTVIIPKYIALKVLDIIKNLNIIILGGDVYMKNHENIFLHTYDSWHYDSHSSLESVEKSRNYLLLLNDENLYVSFVFKN